MFLGRPGQAVGAEGVPVQLVMELRPALRETLGGLRHESRRSQRDVRIGAPLADERAQHRIVRGRRRVGRLVRVEAEGLGKGRCQRARILE